MSNVRGPWGAYVGLLALSFLARMDYAGGQQIICSQKDPASCPTGQYCDNNGMCVPLKTGSDNTTTYVILGCVLGGVVIIVAVIIILYCGRWSWLTRLKDRFGRNQREGVTSGMTNQYQRTPGIAWAKSLRKRFKLKLGGVKRNPYVGQPGMSGISVSSTQMNTAMNVNTAVNNVNPAQNANTLLNTNVTPAVTNRAPVTINTNITPPPPTESLSQETILTRYIVGQDNQESHQFESSSQTPYVATVELSGNDQEPAMRPLGQQIQVGAPSYQYLSGSRHSLDNIDPYQDAAVMTYHEPYQEQPVTQVYYPQPSPRLVRPQINIQSPIPPEPIIMPIQQLEPPAVLEPAAPPPPVVPHTHQVYPSLYPSLGHGHTHAPAATYGELPRKY